MYGELKLAQADELNRGGFVCQEKLKLTQSSSWIGKQQTTLYIATREPSLMSGNIYIRGYLIDLWQKATGHQSHQDYAEYFTVSKNNCSHMQQ